MFSPLIGWDNIYKNEGPLSLGDASQKTPFFLEFTMFAEIEFVQKYCKNWGYGTRASNIVADPRTITTETDWANLSKAIACPCDW